MRCYYNKQTGEIKHILNFDSWMYADEELWEEDIKELEENWENYVEFEGMASRDSFRVMADFTDIVDNNNLRERLIGALNKKKPFQNFKWVIDNSGIYRQQWFDYKKERYIEWVVEQLEAVNSSTGQSAEG
jgi:hypothetical protein